MAGLATIGVYGFDGPGFVEALRAAGVGVVVDVRQRRGVRGSEYAWANARRLEAALREAGLGYQHRRELAPTTELRRILHREDARRGEGQRSRTRLAPEFVERYTAEVLDAADLAPLTALAERTRPALLCVEADPEACHRSLIASRLERDFGLRVRHLRPARPPGSDR